jgi:hypothetical protein
MIYVERKMKRPMLIAVLVALAFAAMFQIIKNGMFFLEALSSR